jgi:hypothetical protein
MTTGRKLKQGYQSAARVTEIGQVCTDQCLEGHVQQHRKSIQIFRITLTSETTRSLLLVGEVKKAISTCLSQ